VGSTAAYLERLQTLFGPQAGGGGRIARRRELTRCAQLRSRARNRDDVVRVAQAVRDTTLALAKSNLRTTIWKIARSQIGGMMSTYLALFLGREALTQSEVRTLQCHCEKRLAARHRLNSPRSGHFFRATNFVFGERQLDAGPGRFTGVELAAFAESGSDFGCDLVEM
jgi:hypothetical protein